MFNKEQENNPDNPHLQCVFTFTDFSQVEFLLFEAQRVLRETVVLLKNESDQGK